jgi:ornithine cyclodeaminase/alanine dehydrogenase-like protein (mu-crystallin family)
MAETLLLSRGDVAALLEPATCRVAVDQAFRVFGQGQSPAPAILGYHVPGGGFHIKVGESAGDAGRFLAVKTNANFPGNPARGLPTVQGLIQVFDLKTGVLIAVMDSIEVTILRTAAATAVAVAHLARPDSVVLTIIGCGVQGRAHVRAIREVRSLRRVQLWDVDPNASARLCSDLGAEAGAPECAILEDLPAGVRLSDIIVTCTSSTRPVLHAEWIAPGSFVAGVGADAEHKHELDPALLSGARVVVDVLDQAASIGDLHHAIEAGVMRREDVHGELGQVVCGLRPGRINAAETFVFDSTGMALQDAAACTVVIERARRQGSGVLVDFGGQRSSSDHASGVTGR